MTYHACTSRWLSWRPKSEREREVDFIAISREKDTREKRRNAQVRSRHLTSPRDRNQSISETTNILTFMTKGAADGRAARTTDAYIRTSRPGLVDSFVKSRRDSTNDDLSHVIDRLSNLGTRHTFANVYSESLESKPEPLLDRDNPCTTANAHASAKRGWSLLSPRGSPPSCAYEREDACPFGINKLDFLALISGNNTDVIAKAHYFSRISRLRKKLTGKIRRIKTSWDKFEFKLSVNNLLFRQITLPFDSTSLLIDYLLPIKLY